MNKGRWTTSLATILVHVPTRFAVISYCILGCSEKEELKRLVRRNRS
jgi:hypothetical protein